jgi:hypothetical protein
MIFTYSHWRRIVKKPFALLLAVLGTVFSLSLTANPAQAQASRTWVSGTGDDTTTCSRTAPCKTFAGAISKTAVGGIINCLDPGGYGTVTIIKSITIDCHEAPGSILANGTTGININFDAFTDPLRIVNLRNLTVEGVGSGIIGISITGSAGGGPLVSIEDCLIHGFGAGIVDARSGGTMTVTNTTVKNNTGSGISMASAGGGALHETLTNVRVDNTNYGIIAGGGAALQINRSVISHNASAGLYAVTSAVMDVNSSAITQNVVGVVVNSGGIVRLSDDDVSFNQGWQGTVQSYGNNRVTNNTNPPFTTVSFE